MVGPVLFSPESHDSRFGCMNKESKKGKAGRKVNKNLLQTDKERPDVHHLSNRLLDCTGKLQQRIALLSSSYRSSDLTIEEYKIRIQCLYDDFMNEVKCLERFSGRRKALKRKLKKTD